MVSNLAGTIRQRLTEAEGVDVSPAWSPDGEYIAFLREAENICEMDKRGSRGVFVINDSGSDSPRVATLYNLGYRRDDTPDGRQVRRARVDGPLAWSPDGDSITFLQEEDLLDTEGPDLRRCALVNVSLEDSPWTYLLLGRDRTMARSDQCELGDPVWSPDGRHVAFVGMDEGGPELLTCPPKTGPVINS